LNEFQALSLFTASTNKISAPISARIMMAYESNSGGKYKMFNDVRVPYPIKLIFIH